MNEKNTSRSPFFNLRAVFGLLVLVFLVLFARANPQALTGEHARQPNGNLFAPSGSVQEAWVARYNGTGNGVDAAAAITVDTSGNIYVTGSSADPGFSDYATIKYNSTGQEQWVVRYDGAFADYAEAIAVDNSGNIYVTGRSFNGGSFVYDYATVKYNSVGQEQWVSRYDGPAHLDDQATAIAVDSSGNVYVTGSSEGFGTGYDYATIKYNSAGQQQWVIRYNGTGDSGDVARGIAIDNSGNVYVTGNSWGTGNDDDYATVKYDSAGQQQWVSRYDGTGNNEIAEAVAVDDSGTVYVTGSSSDDTCYDYATIKYNASGQEQWVARYNGPGNSCDEAYAMAIDGAGNVYVTGESPGSGTSFDYATIKYNSSGQEQWAARYTGLGNDQNRATAVTVDGSGNVYVTGGSTGLGTVLDYATIKYNSTGQEQWVARYDGPGSGDDFADAIALDDSGNVYVTGGSTGLGTDVDYATIKYVQGPTPSPTATPRVTPRSRPTPLPRPTPRRLQHLTTR